MSKDRGTKNVKKAPADKSLGSLKKESAYKSEKNSGQSSQSNIKVFVPKDDNKKGGQINQKNLRKKIPILFSNAGSVKSREDQFPQRLVTQP